MYTNQDKMSAAKPDGTDPKIWQRQSVITTTITKTTCTITLPPVKQRTQTTVTSSCTIVPKKKSCTSNVYIFVEARSVHRVSPDGSLVREDLPPCSQLVATPHSITDIHTQVLTSGVAIYPGKKSIWFLHMVFIVGLNNGYVNRLIRGLSTHLYDI